ncbi:MAG: prepilin-type N-terminal cleavage/methylation domain-containing protein [Actinobacteria bacterium]|nr:prepilin-type N-terminal cleavage/methylation domain-containing protein [Actinomycetota bacterium]MCL6104122.1 prepilin-type N-terminal cleavage/methylation domain-containing protein [Actinomycetota bacterium]
MKYLNLQAGENGFTLVELLIASTIFLVVLVMTIVTVPLFDSEGASVSRGLTAENIAQNVSQQIEDYLTFSTGQILGGISCSNYPGITQGEDLSPSNLSSASPTTSIVFTTNLGPNYTSSTFPLYQATLTFGYGPVVFGVQTYTVTLSAVQQSSTDTTNGCPVFGGKTVYPLDNLQIIANPANTPWVILCSPGVYQTTVNSSSVFKGINACPTDVTSSTTTTTSAANGALWTSGADVGSPAVATGNPPSVPKALLDCVQSVQIEITAQELTRTNVGGQSRSTMKSTVNLLSFYPAGCGLSD